MKIAQVSPLMESVPPKLYGGTERIVSYLTEELVRQGHEVTLFASGDSETAAKLIACAPQALRLAQVNDTLPHHVQQLEKVRRSAFEFDVLHFHTDYLHFPLVPSLAPPWSRRRTVAWIGRAVDRCRGIPRHRACFGVRRPAQAFAGPLDSDGSAWAA